MIHKNTDLIITVSENRPETIGYRSIIFERPIGFDYESGDWIDIQFGDRQLQGGKTYSLSSSPTEPYLMITFKDGLSEIKRGLSLLGKGDRIKIIQYGNDYKFRLKPHKSGVLIAGGVGIAPFRSMIKEMVDTNADNEIVLVYINKSPDLLFKAELDDWINRMPHVRMENIITDNLKSKERVKAITSAIGDLESKFYIAGPEDMVESTEHLLIYLGVSIDDIKIDSFSGY